MSNANSPFGLRPVRRLDGAQPNYQPNKYAILNTDTNKIGKGDLVKFSSGYITLANGSDTQVLGVLDGAEWYDSGQQKKVFSPYWTGVATAVAGTVYGYVYDDTNMVFEIQAGATAVTVASIGINAQIVAGTPNSQSGQATCYLGAPAASQATYPLKVVALSQKTGNDNTSAYNTVEVILNNTTLKAGVA